MITSNHTTITTLGLRFDHHWQSLRTSINTINTFVYQNKNNTQLHYQQWKLTNQECREMLKTSHARKLSKREKMNQAINQTWNSQINLTIKKIMKWFISRNLDLQRNVEFSNKIKIHSNKKGKDRKCDINIPDEGNLCELWHTIRIFLLTQAHVNKHVLYVLSTLNKKWIKPTAEWFSPFSLYFFFFLSIIYFVFIEGNHIWNVSL
jgi:hypothetical protein